MERNPRRRSTVMHARGRIAVAGATGRVGRHVVDVLEERGHEVVAISRSGGVDVVTGEGLADALAGVAIVIDVATQPSPDEDVATAFFTAATRNLRRSVGGPARSPQSHAGCGRRACPTKIQAWALLAGCRRAALRDSVADIRDACAR
jgi:uncharacterized protein YbjT (DUF2867 family)